MDFIESAPRDEEEPLSGEEGEEEEGEEEPVCCSYALTGDSCMIQGVYRCLTCTTEAESNKCCCAGCAESCHWEHDVEYVGYGMAYCDCGAGACELFGDSREFAQKVLGAAGGSKVSHDLDGRIAGSTAAGFKVKEFSEFVWNELTCGDVRQALEEQAEALVRFSKETFWLGSQDAPRCALEAVAAQVFRHHTQGVVLDPSKVSGAEWWVQVKPCNSVSVDGTLTAEGGAGSPSAIDLHYDKDETLAERFSVGIYPQISTVTYITCGNLTSDAKHSGDGELYSNCAPTLVVDNLAAHPVGRAMNRAYLSRPAVGKHISFDGLFLHGVPSHPALRRIRPASASSPVCPEGALHDLKEKALKEQLRITILVNIWAGHRPAAVEPLSSEIISFLPEVLPDVMSRLRPEAEEDRKKISLIRDLPKVTVYRSAPGPGPSRDADQVEDSGGATVVVGGDNGEWITLPFVSSDATWGKEDDEEADLVLKMWMPDLSKALGRDEDTVRIDFVNNMKPARSPPAGKKKKRGASREEKIDPLLSLAYDEV